VLVGNNVVEAFQMASKTGSEKAERGWRNTKTAVPQQGLLPSGRLNKRFCHVSVTLRNLMGGIDRRYFREIYHSKI
jgi:hypothetical protein